MRQTTNSLILNLGLAPSILSQHLMNNPSNLGRVSLSHPSIAAFTRAMTMTLITDLVKDVRQARVDAGHTPRFPNRHPRVLPVLGNQPIHTSVKDAIDKAVLLEEFLYALFPPIPVVPRPFDENRSSNGYGMLSYFNKGSPQFTEQLVMVSNLIKCSLTPLMDVEILKKGTTRTRR